MAQVIGIDSVILIYLLEEHEQFLSKVQRIFRGIEQGKNEAVLSVIGMIEILTGPKKFGYIELANQYKALITQFPHLSIVGINENIVETSSTLRAQYNISTPDAIHVATAIDQGAIRFITNDRKLTRIKEIEIGIIE